MGGIKDNWIYEYIYFRDDGRCRSTLYMYLNLTVYKIILNRMFIFRKNVHLLFVHIYILNQLWCWNSVISWLICIPKMCGPVTAYIVHIPNVVNLNKSFSCYFWLFWNAIIWWNVLKGTLNPIQTIFKKKIIYVSTSL